MPLDLTIKALALSLLAMCPLPFPRVQVAVNTDFAKDMLDLHQRSTKETTVGWWVTAYKLRHSHTDLIAYAHTNTYTNPHTDT